MAALSWQNNEENHFIIFELIKAIIVHRIAASPTPPPKKENVYNLTFHCGVLGDSSEKLSQPTTSGAQEEICLFSFHLYLNRFFTC